MERPADYRHADLFGGHGEVLVWDLAAGGVLPSPFTAVLACRLGPGGSVGRHRQEQFQELVLVTAGRGTATVDDRPCALGPGTLVPLPLGSSLALTNTSPDSDLEYLIIKARQ